MQDLLGGELVRVDRRLLHDAEQRGDVDAAAIARELAIEHGDAEPEPSGDLDAHGVLPGLERVRLVFRLSRFEREALLLALAPEIDDRYTHLFARLGGERRPTVGYTSRLLAGLAKRERAPVLLGPGGHLHRTGLVTLGGDGPRATRTLAIADTFWPRLLDIDAPGPTAVVRPPADGVDHLVLAPSTRGRLEQAVLWAAQKSPHEVLVVVEGPPASGREAIAAGIAGELGCQAFLLDEAELSSESLHALVRETAWANAAVIARAPSAATLALICSEVATPVIAIADASIVRDLAAGPRRSIAVTVDELGQLDREAIWDRAIGLQPRAPDLDIARLASQYRFGPAQIRGIVAAAASSSEARGEGALTAADVQIACRTNASAGSLALRLECPYDDSDLVLPATTRRELALVEAWATHGPVVFRTDGPGGRIRGTAGLVALFAGPPGTGKTMAAQVLARRLHLDLLRVDLSQVVNKYIGETEKNLDRVFMQAQSTGAFLFFDEADALFGKRTDVTTAHDRYANLETAFLLQRLERHPGIVVLATNLLNNVDAAFMRRIQVVAEFPMPGVSERRDIWERHLVREHLAADVDPGVLAAMFEIAGGDVRNAVMTAVLLAASDRTQIAMRHLVVGIWRELNKAGRLTVPAEFAPWQDDVAAYARFEQLVVASHA